MEELDAISKEEAKAAPAINPLEEKKQAHKDHAPLLLGKDLSAPMQQQIDEILKATAEAAGEADSDILKAQAKVDSLMELYTCEHLMWCVCVCLFAKLYN